MFKFSFKIFLLFFFCFELFAFFPVYAQTKNVLSITPPLIKNNVEPGQIWKSYIKVVNNNDNPIDVYITLKNFRGAEDGESVVFLEDQEASQDDLKQWIKMDSEIVNIPALSSKDVSFIVDVPKEASPGGHYVAFLIGTKPNDTKGQGSQVKISSQLTSLLFLNVRGDVLEKGQIREFSSDKSFYFEPKVDFKLRFENIGNVHIQPQGEIRVYDWFGKDKGVMNINHGTEFGNILPKNIREWKFSWKGENNLLEMGRYKAKLVLGYGNETRQTIDQDIYFWVINLKLLAITVLPLLFFLLVIILIIRAYIRRVIRKTKEEYGLLKNSNFSDDDEDDEVEIIEEEIDEDLEETENKKSGFKKFLQFILFIIFIIVIVFGILFFLNKKNNNFSLNQNTVETQNVETQNLASLQDENNNENDKIATSSEEKNLTASSSEEKLEDKKTDKLEVSVFNGSGIAGLAGLVADRLKNDYKVINVSNAESYNYKVSYISYKKGLETEAKKIRSQLFSVKAEIKEVENQSEDLIIIVGSDFSSL